MEPPGEGVAAGRRPPLVVLVVFKGRAFLKLVEEEEEGRRLRGSGTRPGIRGLLVLFGGGIRMGRGEEEGDKEGPGEVNFGREEEEGAGVNVRQSVSYTSWIFFF